MQFENNFKFFTLIFTHFFIAHCTLCIANISFICTLPTIDHATPSRESRLLAPARDPPPLRSPLCLLKYAFIRHAKEADGNRA